MSHVSTFNRRNSLLIRACRREPVEQTPIWLMRQAGRYLPEYRRLRRKVSFAELCKSPDLCAEIAASTVRRLGVDAAILFSDLLLILEAMGLDVEYAGEGGPKVRNPLVLPTDVERLRELESLEPLNFVLEAVCKTRAALDEAVPLIGFAGAPFTLAAYAIEGGRSRDFHAVKTLMYNDTGAWDALLSRLARAVTSLLGAQLRAGADAVQLFDSWAGCLSPEDYRRFVLPHTRSVLDNLPADAPVIHFATDNPALLPLMSAAFGPKKNRPAVVGVDWRISLGEAWQAIGPHRAIQGNLDPAVLLASRPEIRRRVKEILRQADARPGHIFNLGHGVLPETPPENVTALIDFVHELSQR